MRLCKRIVFTLIGTVAIHLTVLGDSAVSPNGYSGLGLVPSSQTLQSGETSISLHSVLPGAINTHGTTSQVGFGLSNGFELFGRLASNDPNCNMYQVGACPPNMIRDMSASLKWSLPLTMLNRIGINSAMGITDIGGAASYSRSYYATVSKQLGENIELSIGGAKAQSATSYLNGGMASIKWNPAPWAQFSLQRVGQTSTGHIGLEQSIDSLGSTVWLSLNQRINGTGYTEKNWISTGINFPLDRLNKRKQRSDVENRFKKIYHNDINKLEEILGKNGFYSYQIKVDAQGKYLFELENTAYSWNIVDAAGVALGAIASTLGEKDAEFKLEITARGIMQLAVESHAGCVEKWLSNADACLDFAVWSAAQNIDSTSNQYTDIDVFSKKWTFRPELQVSPVIASAIGTEYGSFDADIGVNLNAIMPLWSGATLDINRIEPMNIRTSGFKEDGVFYPSRIQSGTNRKMIHQLLNISKINTQARLSIGSAGTVWEGRQLETTSQSPDGMNRLSLLSGKFKASIATGLEQTRDFNQIKFARSWNEQSEIVTELAYGKFFSGDKGYVIGQKFWHGDVNITAYLRRTRLNETDPVVSFAGLVFSLPLTPRQNTSYRNFGFRGTPQWAYTIETKVLDKDNKITSGYGQLLNTGESLSTTFNRDRNSTQYYQSQIWRMRNAFIELYKD